MYDYRDYYNETLKENSLSESEVISAANCASSNKLQNLVGTDLETFSSKVKSAEFSDVWQDNAEGSYEEARSNILGDINKVLSAVSFYGTAETAYVDLDTQLKLLKQKTESLKKTCDNQPSTPTISTDSKLYDVRWSYYRSQLKAWQDKVQAMKKACESMVDVVSQIVSTLKQIDGMTVNTDFTSISLPGYSIVGFGDLLFDDDSYGINQGIEDGAFYDIVDDELLKILKELHLDETNEFDFEWFDKVSHALEEKYGLEKAAELLSNGLERKNRNSLNTDAVVDYMMDKYHVPDKFTCWQILDAMNGENSLGLCHHAAYLTTMFQAYGDNAEAFERDRGFPMYYERDGKLYPNEEMALVDFFIHQNSKYGAKNDGKTLFTVTDNSFSINKGDNIIDFVVKDKKACWGQKEFAEYLRVNNPNLTFESKSVKEPDIDLISSKLEEGYQIHLNVRNPDDGNTYKYVGDLSGGSPDRLLSNKTSTHGVAAVGVDDRGIHIANWNQSMYIPSQDVNKVIPSAIISRIGGIDV